MPHWIWERDDWPAFRYDAGRLASSLAEAAHAIGRLHGRIEALQAPERDRAALAALLADVVKSSAIEGERLDVETVRSFLARRLGVDEGSTMAVDRHVEGVVAMNLDATEQAAAPLTSDRLKAWQGALFPTGRSGLSAVRVAAWRDDRTGPMQVVSGPHGRQVVHYQAPPAERLDAEVARFLRWFESPSSESPLIRAGLAHFWFVTLHPFEDGNGRVSRAIGDMALSRYDQLQYRYYSVSAQIQAERADYYARLERSQRGDLDVTSWLAWFLGCLTRAVLRSDAELDRVLHKALFWQRVATVPLSERQIKALNKVIDGFEQPITNRKWAALTRVSSDTALRDLKALVAAGVLEPTAGGGRSAAYWLKGVPRSSEK